MIKNLPQEIPENLSDLIQIHKNQVVSMTLALSEKAQMTMLSFDEGEMVSEEEYFGDTMYYVLQGETQITSPGKEVQLKEGDVFMVPKHVPHAVGPGKAFKMLQITIHD